MIKERRRIVREAARAADRLKSALESGVTGSGSAGRTERTGKGRKAPVHGSVPLDVAILDCLMDSYEVVLDEIDTVRSALADPRAAGVSVPVRTLQAGFAYLAEHIDDVPEEIGDTIAMTCRGEHGRYARALAGAYGEPSRRCPACDRPSLLPEAAVVADGRGHVLVCSTPECDPAPGEWRRFDLARESETVPGLGGDAQVRLKDLAAMTGIPYRTLDSAVRRARIAPVPTSAAAAGARVYRLADLQALPALRKARQPQGGV